MNRRLTVDQVREILRLRRIESDYDTAQRFGVSRSCIGLIRSGVTWRHLSAGCTPRSSEFRFKTMRERFEEKVDRSEGPESCHLWTSSCLPGGYGRFGVGGAKGEMMLAHRVAWELYLGPIPPGHFVLHDCSRLSANSEVDQKRCVNLLHLYLGTAMDNSSDMVAKGTPHRGENCHAAKISEKEAIEIRALRGTELQRETAIRYGITKAAVSNIQRGRSWRHLG